MTAPSPGLPPKDLKSRLRAVRDAFGNVPGAFRLVWQADPRSTVFMAVLTAVGAVLPVSQAWVGKLIVDAVVNASKAHLSVHDGLRLALPPLIADQPCDLATINS